MTYVLTHNGSLTLAENRLHTSSLVGQYSRIEKKIIISDYLKNTCLQKEHRKKYKIQIYLWKR